MLNTTQTHSENESKGASERQKDRAKKNEK